MGGVSPAPGFARPGADGRASAANETQRDELEGPELHGDARIRSAGDRIPGDLPLEEIGLDDASRGKGSGDRRGRPGAETFVDSHDYVAGAVFCQLHRFD